MINPVCLASKISHLLGEAKIDAHYSQRRHAVIIVVKTDRKYISSLCSQPAQSDALHKHNENAVGTSPKPSLLLIPDGYEH